MGSRTDISEILFTARWSEEGFYLGEIAKTGFPCLVKVTRGQYQNIGQPSFSNPSLFSYLLLFSAGKQLSVAAQCVKFKNQRQRVVPFGPTLAIPQGFEGHFEILSEDGRSVPCILSVDALIKKFPDSCLVREPIKGFKPATPLTSTGDLHLHPTKKDELLLPDKAEKILRDDSVRISDKSRIIQVGEVLVLLGEVVVPIGKNKVSRYLGCFDSKGQTVYLSASQKGKFSPLAREDSISGVHTTKNILTKRMPLMVRLVDGKPPVMTLTKSSSFKFLPELRLFSTLQEELIFAMPLSQCSKESPTLLPLPLSVPLKFQVCRNMGIVEPMKEFCRTLEKVKALVVLTKDLIQIYDINLKKELRFDGRQWKSYAPPIFLSSEGLGLVSQNQNQSQTHNNGGNGGGYEIPDMQDYEDIDEIYDYVRGIKPNPTNAHLEKTKIVDLQNGRPATKETNYFAISAMIPSPSPPTAVSANLNVNIEDRPPEPPPIETIPTNRNRAQAGVGPVRNNILNRSGISHERDKEIMKTNNQKNVGDSGGTRLFRKPAVIAHQLNSAGNSPNNTTTSGSSAGAGSVSANLIRAGKHLYVKKQHSSPGHQHGGVDIVHTVGSSTGDKIPGIISGSPSNRLVFRRSPIFDCRYKSMNDLNRSSLESGSGASATSKVRHFQHNHHQPLNGSMNNVNSSSFRHLLNLNVNSNPNPKASVNGNASRHRHHGLLFRPKSFTSLLMPSFDEIPNPSQGKCNRQLDMVVPSHHHAIHSPPPPPLELLNHTRSQRSRHRNSYPSTAALYL